MCQYSKNSDGNGQWQKSEKFVITNTKVFKQHKASETKHKTESWDWLHSVKKYLIFV
jgi:hypothetical protein